MEGIWNESKIDYREEGKGCGGYRIWWKDLKRSRNVEKK